MVRSTLIAVVVTMAFAAWIYTFYSWLRAIGHRRPHVSFAKLLMSGIASLDEGNFLESGHEHVRGIKRGMLVFFLCILLGIAVGMSMR